MVHQVLHGVGHHGLLSESSNHATHQGVLEQRGACLGFHAAPVGGCCREVSDEFMMLHVLNDMLSDMLSDMVNDMVNDMANNIVDDIVDDTV